MTPERLAEIEQEMGNPCSCDRALEAEYGDGLCEFHKAAPKLFIALREALGKAHSSEITLVAGLKLAWTQRAALEQRVEALEKALEPIKLRRNLKTEEYATIRAVLYAKGEAEATR